MREHGAVVIGGKQVASTSQCCHCGGHFVMVKGSGKRRGFCMRCGQITCGAASCDVCVPLEKQLEIMERRG